MSAAGQLPRYLQDIGAALRAGDDGRALALADSACAEGHAHPQLLVMAAHHRLRAGDIARAEALASRARAADPDSPDALSVLALVMTEAERPREALALLEAGLAAHPGLVPLHYAKAQAHDRLLELDKAEEELRQVIALEPRHSQALAWAATLANGRGDTQTARDHANRALALSPSLHDAHLALAAADLAEKNHAEAERRLAALLADAALSPRNRAFARSLLGDALDGQDRVDEAFAHYAAAKAEMRRQFAEKTLAGESALARAQRLAAYFAKADPGRWRAKPGGAAAQTHVFLLGFPRSGTTLLEQVLASHPDVEAMEERDTLAAAIRDFFSADSGLDRLAAAGEAELEPYRQAYWTVVREFGHRADAPVFIDKMPLNTVVLPLIARLFPRAKVLFALRDPRDVVLSGFRRRFAMTRQMYELTTLDGAAAYYDAVMRLAEIYRPLLGLDMTDTRHEDLLADFDGETRRLCAFLCLPWREEMRGFAARARQSAIHTPSGAQIARGLSRDGVGQWRRYDAQMKEILPVLAPWVARHGYGETA